MQLFASCGVFSSVGQSKTQDNAKPSIFCKVQESAEVMVEDGLLEPNQSLPVHSLATSYDIMDQPDLLPAGWVRVSRCI